MINLDHPQLVQLFKDLEEQRNNPHLIPPVKEAAGKVLEDAKNNWGYPPEFTGFEWDEQKDQELMEQWGYPFSKWDLKKWYGR